MAKNADDVWNVVLVQPPFRYFPKNKAQLSYTRPPLGLAYLAGWLRCYHGDRFSVRILDRITSEDDPASLAQQILAYRPRVVGLSVVTGTVGIAKEIAVHLRRRAPSVRIVVGGPHVSVRPKDLGAVVDAAVVREGEESFSDLLIAWQEGREILGIPGVWSPEAPSRFRDRGFIRELDTIPPPARDLLSVRAYYHTYPYRVSRDHPNFSTMFTSRGCAYDCSFCGNSALWRARVRTFSLERIRAELDEMTERDRVGLVFFDDDSFTMSRSRVMSICALIRERYPYLRWIVHTRVDRVDREILMEMKRSGLVEIQFGLESGDAHVLDRMGKGISLKQSIQAVRWCQELGIRTWGTFILGCPGETQETLALTVRFAKRVDPTYASFIVLLPFPGTRVFEEFDRAGYLRTREWSDYSWYAEPVFETPELSADELLRWRRRANIEFYLRPSKIASVVRDLVASGSPRELWRDLNVWWSLVAR